MKPRVTPFTILREHPVPLSAFSVDLQNYFWPTEKHVLVFASPFLVQITVRTHRMDAIVDGHGGDLRGLSATPRIERP